MTESPQEQMTKALDGHARKVAALALLDAAVAFEKSTEHSPEVVAPAVAFLRDRAIRITGPGDGE